MRARFFFLIDILFILLATITAQFLRDNLELSYAGLAALLPYLCITTALAAMVVPLSGLNRRFWRYSSMPDYQRAVVVALTVTLGSVLLGFAYNRLEGVSRSLPIMQAILAVAFMVGARVAFRIHHLHRRSRKAAVAPLSQVLQRPRTVLVVGLNRLTEVYLQSLHEFERERVDVVGIIGRELRHVGRMAAAQRVLGVPENLPSILRDLQVHGVVVDRIVVTSRLDAMSEDARAALLAVEEQGEIELQFLSEALGFEERSELRRRGTEEAPGNAVFAIPEDQVESMGRRSYWTWKRIGDGVAAAILLVLFAPVMLIISLAVAIDIGVPVTFWQKRPGLGGVPFHLYKFRTMRAAHHPSGRLLSDEERTTALGRFLRRSRLDELPQLYNILRGEMSFVGPRPLLPRDQADGHSARLMVRPGLTGWAQVVGGRIISADDKAALDIWYLRNASLALDLAILWKTAHMIVAGEEVSRGHVRLAWRDLAEAGFLCGDCRGSKTAR